MHRYLNILQPLALIIIIAIFAYNVSYWFFIGDDAYISFRYANNLARGYGLTWNIGENPVEGYTNFSWVIIMALGLLANINPEHLSAAIGIVSSVTLLFLLYRFSNKDIFALSLLLTLALSRSYTAWSTSGLETMFFTLLVFLGISSLISAQDKSTVPWFSAIILACACLTRPEAYLFSFIAGAIIFCDFLRKKKTLKTVLLWSLPIVITVATHLLWRLYYYGYPLPNTFYAKVAGLWLEQSKNYLSLFNAYYNIVWFLPLLIIALFSKRKYEVLSFSLIVTLYLAYVIYVGGDKFEFRFLVIIFPYFYWLLSEGIRVIASTSKVKYLAPVILVALLLTTHLGSQKTIPDKERYGIGKIKLIEKYASARVKQGKFLKRMIENKTLPENFTIAVGGAGAVPYFSDLRTIDRRGLNDKYIAHLKLEKRGSIAHEHDAPHKYLIQEKVAVFDVFNRIIQNDLSKLKNKHKLHDGHELRLRAIPLEDKYMVFATYLSDHKLGEIFKGLQIIKKETL